MFWYCFFYILVYKSNNFLLFPNVFLPYTVYINTWNTLYVQVTETRNTSNFWWSYVHPQPLVPIFVQCYRAKRYLSSYVSEGNATHNVSAQCWLRKNFKCYGVVWLVVYIFWRLLIKHGQMSHSVRISSMLCCLAKNQYYINTEQSFGLKHKLNKQRIPKKSVRETRSPSDSNIKALQLVDLHYT